MKVKTKLITVFLIIIAFIAGAGFVGVYGSIRIFKAFDKVVDKTTPMILALGKIESLVNKIQTEAVSLSLIISEELQEQEEEEEEEEEMLKAKEQLKYWIAEFEKHANDETEKYYITLIKEKETSLFKKSLKLISAKRQGRHGQKILEIKEELEKTEEEFEQIIDAVIEKERKELIEGNKFADMTAEKTTLYSIIISISSFIFALGIGLYISHSISNQIIKLRDTTIEIGSGKLETRAEVKSRDEIGDLADSFNKMAANLQQITFSRDYVNNIIQTMTDTLIVVKPDGTIQMVNQVTLDLLGYTSKELIDKPIGTIFAEEELSFSNTGFADLNKKGNIKNIETVYLTKEGKKIHFLLSGAVMKDAHGKINGIVYVATDITEKIKLQEEAMRAGQFAVIGELAANVAHEINNPINAIIVCAEILCDQSETEKIDTDITNRILGASVRISNVVKSLLSFARKGDDDLGCYSICDLLTEALTLTTVQTYKDSIKVITKILSDLPKVLVCPQHIQQVFMNILSNARYALNEKHSNKNGCKTITITGEVTIFNGKQYVLIAFHDKGIGIPANKISKVMDTFYTTKPRGKGTGLGLSICQKILSDYGGKIEIDSIEGEYTNVKIYLPTMEKVKVSG